MKLPINRLDSIRRFDVIDFVAGHNSYQVKEHVKSITKIRKKIAHIIFEANLCMEWVLIDDSNWYERVLEIHHVFYTTPESFPLLSFREAMENVCFLCDAQLPNIILEANILSSSQKSQSYNNFLSMATYPRAVVCGFSWEWNVFYSTDVNTSTQLASPFVLSLSPSLICVSIHILPRNFPWCTPTWQNNYVIKFVTMRFVGNALRWR